jgi:hypothetical protein
MLRPRRYTTLLSLAALAVLVFGVIGVRLADPSGTPRRAAAESPEAGVAEAESADLAALARRVRALRLSLASMRERLAETEGRGRRLRDQAEDLDHMLAADALTQSPPFLRDETTVLALQSLLTETGDDRPETTGTEAVAARRLRQKLALIRDRYAREADGLERLVETLRAEVRARSEQVVALQKQVSDELSDEEAGAGPARPQPHN